MKRLAQVSSLLFWVALVAVALTIKYYPGIENATINQGNIAQIIYSGDFVGDAYRDGSKPFWSYPTLISIFYGLVALVGEIALDDRFVVVFYIALVMAGLFAALKIAELFGVTRRIDQLLVLAFFAKDHQVYTAKVTLAHQPGINPTSLAMPATLWLMYVTLAGRNIFHVMAACGVLVLSSPRMALYACTTSFICRIFLATGKERIFTAASLVLVLTVFVTLLMHMTPSEITDRLFLWQAELAAENNDADPYAGDAFGFTALRFGLMFAIVALAYFLAPNTPARRPLRIVLITASATMLVMGAYLHVAPDDLKLPLLISFVPARIGGWLLNLSFIALLATIVQTLRSEGTNDWQKPQILAVLGLLAMFIAGPGNIGPWTGLTVGSFAIAYIGMRFIAGKGRPTPLLDDLRHGVGICVLALAIALSVTYAVAGVRNADAWRSVITDGVYGNNLTAPWRDVSRYLKDHTPFNTVVLPYECENPNCTALYTTRAIASRSARGVAVPMYASSGFNERASWDLMKNQRALIEKIAALFLAKQYQDAAPLIDELISVPNILVLPSKLMGAENVRIGRYTETARVGKWVVYSDGQ